MKMAVIGGTGLATLDGARRAAAASGATPYGQAAAVPWCFDAFADTVFLDRHGAHRSLLPHEINYRANLWLLRELEVEAVVAVLAVGGIAANLKDGDFVLPRQIVDYTWGREHTYAGGGKRFHADFSEPFALPMRRRLLAAAETTGVALHDGGVYGCTQGPRLETPAEIDRMERDGCTVVGMTAMPEAALARELELPYGGLCLVVNPAAGRGVAAITPGDMLGVVESARPQLLKLLHALCRPQ